MTRAAVGARRFVPVAVVLIALAAIGAVTLIKPAATTAAATSATAGNGTASATAGNGTASDTTGNGTASKTASSTLIRQVPISTAIRACPPGAATSQNRIALISASGGSASGSSGGSASGGSGGSASGGSGGSPVGGSPVGGAAVGGSANGPAATLSPLPQDAGRGGAQAHPASATAVNALSLISVPAAPAATSAARQQAWSIAASGAMAQGLEAEVADASGQGSVRCGEPDSDTWFVGPGQQDGAAQIQLDLMNVDALAATVNVNVITDAGAVQGNNDAGINVPPHTLVTESLAAQTAGASVAAIEVHTSAGRVAADVTETASHGATTWLPTAAPPATRLVIPGIPPSGTAASLFLVVPGNAAAKVSVVAVTAQGRYQPFGAQSIDLPGQSASDVQLTPIGGAGAALQLISNVPVTAAVLVPGSGLGTFTAATAPVAQQAVIAGNPTTGGFTASMALSAPGAAGHVRLTEIAEGTPPSTQVLTIPSGRTVAEAVKVPSGARRGVPFTVVITPLPGSGPVYAARVETHGQNTVVSILPAVSALTTTGLPPVRASYTAISP